MRYTEAFYEERREKITARAKEYRDNRKAERAAYRKLFLTTVTSGVTYDIKGRKK